MEMGFKLNIGSCESLGMLKELLLPPWSFLLIFLLSFFLFSFYFSFFCLFCLFLGKNFYFINSKLLLNVLSAWIGLSQRV